MFECNYFKNIRDKDCTTVVPVVKVLKAIRNGQWKEQIEAVRSQESKKMITELKNKLPNVTFSGVFEDERLDENIVMYNHLVIIDIDTIGPRRLIRLRRELQDNHYVVAFFAGPSKGIKVLFMVDTQADEHNTYAFHALEHHFKEIYGVEIDKSGKNIARVCFVSYDPETYINLNFQTFPVDKSIWESNENYRDEFVKINTFKSEFEETNSRKIFDRCKNMVKKSRAGSYHKGNRNNYIFVLSCLLSEFGVPEEQALQLLFEKYESLEYKELKSTCNSAYRKTHQSFGSRNSGSNQMGMFG